MKEILSYNKPKSLIIRDCYLFANLTLFVHLYNVRCASAISSKLDCAQLSIHLLCILCLIKV
ncbi:hypothetical protein M2480_002330 [Parabacteroides sp. PFB2-12]|nr:hypothetical protein [Parabacteroides sp. PM6-13]MDH6391335.1 hypothetical protein [Parabacteroides sp. PFB2-12]